MKHQLFADYLERLEGLQRGLHKDVRDLPAEAMDWLPGPAMNSVAVLLAHMVGVLHEGMAIALGDPPGRVRAGISDARWPGIIRTPGLNFHHHPQDRRDQHSVQPTASRARSWPSDGLTDHAVRRF